MKFVKLALRRKPISVIIDLCRIILGKMTGNAYFPTPSPSLKKIGDAVDELETAYEAAIEGGRSLKETQRIKLAQLLVLMTQLMFYVQDVSGGDPIIIMSSGMGIKKTSTPRDLPGAPANLRDVKSIDTGLLSLIWDAVKGADYYVVYYSNNPIEPDSWVFAANSGKGTVSLSGLPSGKNAWVRIAAVNYRGQGAWSDQVMKMVS